MLYAHKQATKVSNKVKSKMRTAENMMDREGGSGGSHNSDHSFPDGVLSDHREDAISSGDSHNSVSGVFSHPSRDEHSPGKLYREYSGDEGEGKLGLKNVISSKAEAWMVKKGISWPWKGNEREGSEARASRFVWPWLHNDQENESDHQKSSSSGATKPESVVSETPRPNNNEAYGSWSSSCNVNSTSSGSSCGSTNSSAANKVDADSDSLDYEILWEDLTIGEQIGQGINLLFKTCFFSIFLFCFCYKFLFVKTKGRHLFTLNARQACEVRKDIINWNYLPIFHHFIAYLLALSFRIHFSNLY